jgi:hypothetical protein
MIGGCLPSFEYSTVSQWKRTNAYRGNPFVQIIKAADKIGNRFRIGILIETVDLKPAWNSQRIKVFDLYFRISLSVGRNLFFISVDSLCIDYLQT